MITSLSRVFSFRNIIIDFSILGSIYFIPAISHYAPFQLYLLDPMRIFMLAGFLLTRQNTNAYLLAFTIPIFSALVSGHPPLFKAILMSFELLINILLFIKLLNRSNLNVAILLFLSIFGSKLIYYALKFVFIKMGFVEGTLITTNLWLQLASTILTTSVFYMVWVKSGLERRKLQ